MNKRDIQALVNGFKNFSACALELFYPSVCVICGRLSAHGVCEKCKKEYPIIMESKCMCCGKPIEKEEAEFCEDCKSNKKLFYQGRSLWVHRDKVKTSIYLFKYKNRRIYGETYAKLLVAVYGRLIEEWNPSCIIPVPVHKKRRRKRGYNQAEVLAQYLVQELRGNISLNTRLISRNKETGFQKVLDNKQRKKNISGAFKISREYEVPETVLIVDDIYTTGATMNEMAKILRGAGVRKVVFLTISVGQGY